MAKVSFSKYPWVSEAIQEMEMGKLQRAVAERIKKNREIAEKLKQENEREKD